MKKFTSLFLVVIILSLVLNACGESMSPAAPTSGVILQEGNNLPQTSLQPKQSRELKDNRIGGMWTLDSSAIPTPEQYADWLNGLVYGINNLGLKWVHSSIDRFDWNVVEEYSKYYIDSQQDKAITDLVNNGIKIRYCIVFWDEAIQVEEEGYSRFKTEDEIQRYLDYVHFIVHHFKDRIEYYEILNEPNVGKGTQQYVEVEDYINLVKRTVPIIRQEYPEAKIVAGAVTPLIEPGAREYFFDILKSDVMPLVDAVSWHPMGGASPEYEEEHCYNHPSLLQEIKDVASSNGFEGEYIADELHWRSHKDPHPHEYWGYSETTVGKYFARGILMHRGMGFTTGLCGIWHDWELYSPRMMVVRNLCTIMAGTEPASLPIEIQSEATNIRSYSFCLTNGDQLIALWTDGVAVDEDPGVKATLTLPGFSAQEVIGIDVLNGFEQQMITSIENGNPVIRNLLVKDYPIIFRFIAIRYP